MRRVTTLVARALALRFGSINLYVWTSNRGMEGAWWELAGEDWSAEIGDAW